MPGEVSMPELSKATALQLRSPLVTVSGLRKAWRSRQGTIAAVDGVSFTIHAGETLAVVGESGCGKSTLALMLLGLVRCDAGEIGLHGSPPALAARSGRKAAARMAVVFQSPQSSLNPKMRVRAILEEPLLAASALRGQALAARVGELLQSVGLSSAYLKRYPHELSGGQMQRVAIARALALDPELIILDEPTAALDVSVQAQLLQLLRDIQQRRAVSYLFISHDLGAVDCIADRVIVMYLGRIVESGPVAAIFKRPRHPYTRALLDAVPAIDPRRRGVFAPLKGEVPSPLLRPSGCAFAPRCQASSERCRREAPALLEAEEERTFACWHPLPAIAQAGGGAAVQAPQPAKEG